jgi:hypothetical protein
MRTIRIGAILFGAALFAEPSLAAFVVARYGFSSDAGGQYYWGQISATLEATEVLPLLNGGYVEAKGWITENGAQRGPTQHQCFSITVCASLTCRNPAVKDYSLTDGIPYCVDGEGVYVKANGDVWKRLDAEGAPICTTVTGLPPTQPQVSASFLGCHEPNCARWRFTFFAQRATKYRIERKCTQCFTWTHVETVGSSPYNAHLAGNDLDWRIRGENYVDPGPWKTFMTQGKCNDGGGGGGGGGPID